MNTQRAVIYFIDEQKEKAIFLKPHNQQASDLGFKLGIIYLKTIHLVGKGLIFDSETKFAGFSLK